MSGSRHGLCTGYSKPYCTAGTARKADAAGAGQTGVVNCFDNIRLPEHPEKICCAVPDQDKKSPLWWESC